MVYNLSITMWISVGWAYYGLVHYFILDYYYEHKNEKIIIQNRNRDTSNIYSRTSRGSGKTIVMY